MANNSSKLSSIQPKNNADGSDQIVAFSNVSSNDVLIPVSNLFTNTTLMANKLVLLQNNTPANSSSYTNNTPGNIWCDNNFLYFSTSNTNIVRVALASF